MSSFVAFIFQNKINKRLLIIAVSGILLEFIFFKSFYPVADFHPDSAHYVYAASKHWNVNFYPIGYSKFLMIFHELTHSDTALVCFQYLFLELSCLFLFFTLLFFYSPSKTILYILFIFLFFNPLFIYLCNHISSDSLFAALSISWLTELLWIIQRSKKHHIFYQAILLFLCFTIRNNAYYYPIIAIVAILLSKNSLIWKLSGIALPFLFIIPFIIYTQYTAKELTGKRQYSFFTGWQLANNALYMYQYIVVDSSRLPSETSRELDRITRVAFTRVDPNFNTILSEYEGNYFIKDPQFTLKQYYSRHFKAKNRFESLKNWGVASSIFEEYGGWLIKHHPYSYVKYFILPNIKNYFLPPLESLKTYNNDENRLDPVIQDWFDFKTPDINATSWEIQERIFFIYPYIIFFLNVLLAGSLVWVLFKKILLFRSKLPEPMLIVLGSFLLFNFCFSISATIIVLRYNFVPMIITLIFSLLLMDLLDRREQNFRLETNTRVKGSFAQEPVHI